MMNLYRLVRSLFVAFALLLGLVSSAWAGGIVYRGNFRAEVQQVPTVVLHEDFEDDPLGPLGAPWTITPTGGNGSVSIVNTPNHGHVLQLQGDPAEYLIAKRPLSSASNTIITKVDIRPSAGASFIWVLNGAGSSIGRRRIRLQQDPGSTTLVAQTVPSGSTNCGTLPPDAWSRVTLIVHTVPRTFDVRIRGVATACTGISTGLQPPFNSVSVMDAGNAGWGGQVLFDNIDVTTP